jgi:DNA-binding SARP family transcriptional activator
VHLLGRFSVERAGMEIPATAWKRKRPVELLVALALAPGRALHREELIDRLWPDKDLDAGANNLYRALHDLRRTVGEEIAIVERSTVRLADGVWTDVEAFENAVASSDRALLGDALSLYRGELLPDDPYSELLEGKREALRQRFVDAALRLARELDGHASDRQVELLRRLLEVAPATEEAHRLLMLALARAGRAGDALKQFTRCVAVLREKLDREPARETRELQARIASGELGAEARPARRAGWSHVARRLLGTCEPRRICGRAPALCEIETLVGAGRGVRLLIGEAGAGKSRLAVEGARLASEAGAVVLAGIGYDFAATAPYTPFVDAWTDHLRAGGDPVTPNPFLAFRPTPGASAQEDRLRLFQAVEQALAGLAGKGGVYLFLEDVHLADESSLHLLHYLARATRQLPLMLVATLREEEVRAGTPLHTLLGGLQRERLAERIQLGRLDRAATGEMVADLVGRACDAAIVDAVQAIAEGNPFYTEEVVRALGDADPGSARPALPADLLDGVRQRVSRLGRDAERLLAVASVVGQHFEFETVRRAVELDAAPALDALERGLEARIIEEDGQGYRFRHALTRQALYGALTHARRVYLHRAVAEALEQQPERVKESLAEMLAHHHEQAGQLDRALPHLLLASERARNRLGFGEAVGFCEQALSVLDVLGEEPGPQRFGLLASMGSMRVALGELGAAVRDLDHAAELARRDGWRPSPDERARAWRMAALALIEAGELDQAEARLERALAEIGAREESSELSSLLYLYAQLRWHQARHREAYELAERCLAEAERRDDQEAIAKGFEMLALACHSLGEWREGREYEKQRQQRMSGTLDVASAFDVHL